MNVVLLADVAALVATVLAAVGTVPQLRAIAVTGDIAGVSAATAALGITTELTWSFYSADERLWSALPESLIMTAANAALLCLLCRNGVSWRRPVIAGCAWAVALGCVAAGGGARLLGATLGASYLVQVGPAMWTVVRTAAPSGVVAATWMLVAVEALLWGGYGLVHGDPATLTFGVMGLGAAVLVVGRLLTWRTAELTRS